MDNISTFKMFEDFYCKWNEMEIEIKCLKARVEELEKEIKGLKYGEYDE